MLSLRALLSSIAILAAACGSSSTPAAQPAAPEQSAEPQQSALPRINVGTLSVALPDSWQSVPTSSRMRAAQWQVSAGGATADIVVYHFGPGGGGGVDANLARWYSQLVQPDGSKTADKAVVNKRPIAGIPVTTVDVSGTYVAETRPGSGQRVDQPGWRMLAAIVEIAHGWYYIKFVGPESVVAAHADRWQSFIDSIRPVPVHR